MHLPYPAYKASKLEKETAVTTPREFKKRCAGQQYFFIPLLQNQTRNTTFAKLFFDL
jgi:hypothetical protein